jgi:Flp pilus assembly protein TadD
MKRITMFLVAMTIMAGANLKSQSVEGTSILNYGGLESKMKKSDEDILNEKKNTKAKTFTSRAQVFLDIYNVHNDVLKQGMEPMRAKLFLKEPKDIQTSQNGNEKIDVYVYDRVDLKFINDKLDSWTEKNKIFPTPLVEAKNAIDKAIELNTDQKANSDILKVIEGLKTAYQTEAIRTYEKQNYKESYENFSNMLVLNKLPLLNNPIDTVIIYFAGRAALENKDYKEAIRLLDETASYNYNDPLLPVFRKQAYFANGDTAKGLEAIKEGFEKYPEDQSIMIEMINYYLDANQGQEALNLIAKAKAGDPNNVSYNFTEGTLLDKMGRFDDAVNSYKECIAVKPDYYYAHYNLGVMYYNRAVKIYEEASRISNQAAYEKKQSEADEAVKLAIPYMEKVAEMESSESADYDTKKSALETLRTIYYRLKMEDKRQEVINKLNSL